MSLKPAWTKLFLIKQNCMQSQTRCHIPVTLQLLEGGSIIIFFSRLVSTTKFEPRCFLHETLSQNKIPKNLVYKVGHILYMTIRGKNHVRKKCKIYYL